MSPPPFGLAVTAVVGVYLVFLLLVGGLARRRHRDGSLAEFYLAGRRLGSVVLLLTLYATQYSGNTLVGYPGEAYRLGFAWVMSVGFMTAIVVVYLLMAPRLFRLSRRYGFVTPGDWLDHRFGSPALSLTANALLALAIGNYLLAQLMAMGHVVAGLSDGAVPYWVGVVLLAAVIIVYETLGGMRAVAWTDALQGAMLLLGLLGLLAAVAPGPDRLAATTRWLAQNRPETVAVPDGATIATWVSTVLLIGLSGPVYPQAIQRIYAAGSLGALRRSLAVMALLPLFTVLTVLLVGIFGIAELGGLGGLAADQVMPLLLRLWAERSPWMYAMALLVAAGVVAAIMSTADSVLLSLSSMLAKDFAGKHLLRGASEEALTRLGKALSWIVMALLVGVALVPRTTLWGLVELKMELLAQIAPLFLLGLAWRGLRAPAALAGLLVGTALAGGLTLAGYGKIAGIHAGLVGCLANALVAAAWSCLVPLPRSVLDEGTA